MAQSLVVDGDDRKLETFAAPVAADDLPGAVLLKQGAEGRVYTLTYLGRPCVVKERFNKRYRIAALDSKLTKERVSWVCFRVVVVCVLNCNFIGLP